MKVYIASSLSNYKMVREIIQKLTNEGITISYDWTKYGEMLTENNEISPIDELGDIAQKELNGVLTADHLLVIMPGGRGTHVELGAMIVKHYDKEILPITILLNENDNYITSFHYLPGIFRTYDEDEAIDNVIKNF